MITPISPEIGAEVSLLSDIQRTFIEKHLAGEDAGGWVERTYYRCEGSNIGLRAEALNLTKPAEVLFRWLSDRPSHLELRYVGEAAPNSPLVGEIRDLGQCGCEKDGRAEFLAGALDLFAASEYRWKIVADDGSEESEERTFRTAEEFPRAIFAEGSSNIRDLGGVKNFEGRRVRQGCIYRGAALESSTYDMQYALTGRGRRVLHDIIKIKTELDLRHEAIDRSYTSSPIGEDIDYKIVIANADDHFFDDERTQDVKKLIEIVADENNYPIYFHCQAGADRTGIFAMVIHALLGVDVDIMRLDYNITSLTIADVRRWGGRHNGIYEGFSSGGESVPVQARVRDNLQAWLMEKCGLDAEVFDRLRRNMLV